MKTFFSEISFSEKIFFAILFEKEKNFPEFFYKNYFPEIFLWHSIN